MCSVKYPGLRHSFEEHQANEKKKSVRTSELESY